MSEDTMVDHRDVEQREDSDEACHDGPEEELVAPDVVHPLCEVQLGARLHAEEAAAEIDHLPGQEEGEPGQTDEGRGSSSENGVALGGVVSVAVRAQVAVSKAIRH